jgi:hypothetical protein
LKKKKKEKDQLEDLLKKKIDAQQRQQKFRNERKKTLAKLCETNQEITKALKVREKIGRLRLEIEQPDLLKAIVDIALYGSAAHEKRQSDVYRSIKTLQELTDQLVSDGFKISRSGVYLRLLPKRNSNLERKRHVETVPVRLIRAQNDAHSKHIDMHFFTATIKHLKESASILGPNEVFFKPRRQITSSHWTNGCK